MSFSDEKIQSVWEKGEVVPNYDPKKFRKDACSAWMKRDDYGKLADLGWNIDHIKPQSKGGSDDLSNLRPLFWKNNSDKSDGRLKCNWISEGNKNIEKK